MRRLTIPEGYRPSLNLVETERAIKQCKDLFESELAALLKLTRVSAPLFVLPQTGLNDNLNGVERPRYVQGNVFGHSEHHDDKPAPLKQLRGHGPDGRG